MKRKQVEEILRLAELVIRFDVLMAEKHPECWMPEHARLIEQLKKAGYWHLPTNRVDAAAILTANMK